MKKGLGPESCGRVIAGVFFTTLNLYGVSNYWLRSQQREHTLCHTDKYSLNKLVEEFGVDLWSLYTLKYVKGPQWTAGKHTEGNGRKHLKPVALITNVKGDLIFFISLFTFIIAYFKKRIYFWTSGIFF